VYIFNRLSKFENNCFILATRTIDTGAALPTFERRIDEHNAAYSKFKHIDGSKIQIYTFARRISLISLRAAISVMPDLLASKTYNAICAIPCPIIHGPGSSLS